MNIRIEKRNIIFYLFCLIGGIVFSSFYGGPLSYGVLYALFLIIPVAVLYIFLNYKYLCIFQEIEVHKLTKGEEHNYRLLVENNGLLPIHEMKLKLYTDRCILYEIKDGDYLSLNSFEKRELKSGINCLYAGAYDIGLEKVSFVDPFNLFTVEIDIPYSFRAIVSPRITDIADKVLDLENLVNNMGLKSASLFEEIPGNEWRKYQNGDSVNAINWKVSARLSQLVVRTPDKMEKKTVTIIMEAANVPRGEQNISFLERRDNFLEFVVSAAWHFGKQGVPVKLIYPSGKIVEKVVDSYESFFEFYDVIADGIFYESKKNLEDIQHLVCNLREQENGDDTWIILKEDYDNTEDFITICG